MKFTKVIFRPIKRLNYWEVGFRRGLLFSVVKREFNSRHYNTQLRVDLMTFQTIDYNLRTSRELDFRLIKASKNNLSEIHISRPTP